MLCRKDAIEPLYSAFEGISPPTYLDRSPLKSDLEQETYDQLLTLPLREVPPEILGPYASSALFTVGTQKDYRFFLPRILEISLYEQGWSGFEPWAIANKLEYGEWHNWPRREIEALRLYFAAGFEHACQFGHTNPLDLECWLVAMLTIREDPQSLFKLAIAQNAHGALIAIAGILMENQKPLLSKHDFADNMWHNVDRAARKEIVQFFASDTLKMLLIEHGGRASEEDQFHYFQPALDVAEQL